MKKLFALTLAVMMLASMATVASAAEATTTKSTTLTTSVPAATYTLNIPEDQEIAFGATRTRIGNITVTNASGFAEGKNLNVAVTYGEFESEAVSTTIPFTLEYTYCPFSTDINREFSSGKVFSFIGEASGTVTEEPQLATVGQNATEYEAITGLNLTVASEDWGKALAGDYTATITFTAEVVVEE